ncbi:uncharacterized protein LOC130804531 isoform X2 [Amaranthus tricolor]|uniref:uncharacterized protein LOC130804531 isoform X2 n=1 Tax=Amaranthus tricolor TaxID=29722 RepID=UPI0025863D76|nr:uncharacterized protein LOC130804531 isoform X2 [Amaranthus tricolor]
MTKTSKTSLPLSSISLFPYKTTMHHLPTNHLLLLLLFTIFHLPSLYFSDCRSQCGSIPIHYPFSIDDGCGAPQFRNMFTCNISSTSLFFITPNGNYKVQSIDYKTQTLTVYDPDMSTCTVLQPHHDIHLSDIQYAIIPPSPDTIFALLNCSIDSPILHRFSDLCFDFASHKCQELYSSCNSFRVFTTGLVNPGLTNSTGPAGYFYGGAGGNNFNYNSNSTSTTGFNTGNIAGPGLVSGSGSDPPPCCFTGYSTVKVMSMDILDCTHYTSFYDADKLRGVRPMDWSYGIKFSYSVPDMGCERCTKSGGNCGFDVQTEALLCLCPGANNSTRQCDFLAKEKSKTWIHERSSSNLERRSH